jgi:hypothetical protein
MDLTQTQILADGGQKFANFKNWVPARIYGREGKLFVDWCYVGSERFVQPFFDDTMSRVIARPFSVLFRHQTPLDLLGELCEESPGIAPSGFILHMSRCGSTLAAQMLASLPRNIVMSEPPPVDNILRSGADEADRIKWLKWIIGALGQKRFPEEENYYIKFDSWSTLELGSIRKAFPGVPWIFLYRDPVEVMVSQMRQRGAQMIPGAVGQLLPGMSVEEMLSMPAEEYCARVLGRFCESALEHALGYGADEKIMLVNYRQLPEVMADPAPRHFGVSYLPDEIEKMKTATQFNAKTPQVDFKPDSKEKKDSATDAIREAAAKWIQPAYEKLEAIRNGT